MLHTKNDVCYVHGKYNKGGYSRTTLMRCPDTAAFHLSPPLVARPLTRLAIRSGSKSHPGFHTQPQPVRHVWKAIALARFDHTDRYGRVRAVRGPWRGRAITCGGFWKSGGCSRSLTPAPGYSRIQKTFGECSGRERHTSGPLAPILLKLGTSSS